MPDQDQTKHLPKAAAVAEITEQVYQLIGNPISTWAVAATIESLGVRNIDVLSDFGYNNVFELGDEVYARIKTKERQQHEEADIDDVFKVGSFGNTVQLFFKHYTKGMVFSIPMLSQVIAIFAFGYALWAWFDFNEAQATVVALGTIVAFIFTGGFIQTLGRLIAKYKGEGNYYLASKATWAVMKIAIPSVFVLAAVLFVFNLILPFYPQPLMLLSLIYMVFISLLLLASSILFAAEQRTMITISIVLGTLVVIFGMDVAGMGIYLSQWLGIFVSTVVIALYSWVYYRLKIRSLKQELFKQELPESEVNYYNVYRYFLYGFCYFMFLFMDRLMAWSAGPPPPEYIIWFNTPYELGMDWALISFVLTIAILEYSINSFSVKLIPAQKNAVISKFKRFNRFFKSFYNKQIVLLLVIGSISILVTYFGVLSLRVFEKEMPKIADFFSNPVIYKVFWMASIGYLFLIFGLLNSLFFFTLNRPEFVMYSMIGSLFVNFIIGFICSRIFGLEYAVVGLIAGSITFAFSTGILAKRFFKHLDYFYYSAY